MTEEKRLLEVVPPEGNPEDETCLTFVLNEEDHTLGNALRYVIMKNPEVQFCGYNIPHPSEKKINLRIQTDDGRSTSTLELPFQSALKNKEGISAKDVLKTGLKNLNAACEHILGTFEQSVTDYKASLEERESGERDPDEQSSSSEGEDEDVAMEEDSDDS